MTIPQQTFVLPPLPNLHVYPTRKRYDNFLPIGNWTKEEDELLQKLISQDSLNVCNENNRNKKKQWHQIANYFKDKTPQQIMNHWNKVINPTLVKGNWSREEDQLLIKWVNEHGERGWTKIAAQLPGRVGKQCICSGKENGMSWKTMQRKMDQLLKSINTKDRVDRR